MMKKIIVLMAVIIGVAMAPAQAVWADGAIQEGVDDSCAKGILGMRPWYQGLTTRKNDKCVVGTPSEEQMPLFVWTIVLNLLADLFAVVGYLALGFVMYGGWLYLRSEGDPGMVAKGKKTLVSAMIGIAIALLANVIVNAIIGVLTSAAN